MMIKPLNIVAGAALAIVVIVITFITSDGHPTWLQFFGSGVIAVVATLLGAAIIINAVEAQLKNYKGEE